MKFLSEKKDLISMIAFYGLIILSVFIVFYFINKGNKSMVEGIFNEIPNTEIKNSKPVNVTTHVDSQQKNNSSNKNSSKNYVPASYFTIQMESNKIYVKNRMLIKVNIKPDNATEKGVTFSSDNPSIAKVNKSGIITGVKAGTCYIKVELKAGAETKVKIEVVDRPKSSESSSNSNSNNNSNNNSNTNSNNNSNTNSNTNSTNPNTNPNTNSNTSSNNNSSTNSNSNSNTNSNVNSSTGSTNSNVAVSSIKLSKTSLSLTVGASSSISATISPSNASNKKVTWSSSDTKIATVSNGKITGKKAGTVTITAKSSNGKTATCKVTVKAKNGWYTEGGKKYYYKNGSKVKNSYVDYIYLDSKGVAQAKIGSFSATLYGARAWANQKLVIRKSANSSSASLGSVPEGGKMTILSAESSSTKYIKIKYGSTTGYVYSESIYINLPDIVPDAIYEISNANKSIFKAADKNIPNITGKNLYGFTKAYNSKTGKTTYYAPLLYPVAKQFQKAYNSAVKKGYNLKVYDSYRPRSVEELVTKNYKNLYNSNKTVQKAVNYDKNGVYWGWPWFMTSTGTSRHCQGIALDLTLTNSKGTELSAQSKIHMLDTRSLRKYNNSTAKTLSSIMTSAGFETLESEWWHFEENTYQNNPYTYFKIK